MSQSIFEWTHFISASCQKFFSNIDDITKIVNVAVCTYLRPAILFLMQILSFWIRKLSGLKSCKLTGVRININVTEKCSYKHNGNKWLNFKKYFNSSQLYLETFWPTYHFSISRLYWYLHINIFKQYLWCFILWGNF